jgi:isopentenyl-diphosphate delta-isomerase type 1
MSHDATKLDNLELCRAVRPERLVLDAIDYFVALMSRPILYLSMALRVGALRAFPLPLGLSAGNSIRKTAHRYTTRAMSTYGSGMSQQAMMESDLLIPVDESDNILPNTNLSKREGHAFSADNPRAFLHRAFSLFIFDYEGRLLLTQRANSKITFPSVWTNTCCSHPLYGMIPDEVDEPSSAFPSFPGIKHAAIRKCKHELGIPSQHILHDKIQFITRFHYWAADTRTYGSNPPWGEHEVDYILFYQQRPDEGQLPIIANPEEVSDYKYVTADELQSMMKEPDQLWSPWFVGIMERGGWDWWADLQGSFDGKYTNKDVTFFDPPPDHFADFNLPTHGRLTGVISRLEPSQQG